jgi:hypothetical protein
MADTSFRNVIGGELVGSGVRGDLRHHRPDHREVYATAPMSGAEDIDRAYRAAEKAFQGGWGDTTPSERQRALLKIADALEKRAQEFVAVESRDTASRSASRSTRSCRRRSTSSGSSPARPGCSRASPRASTSRTTPPSYDASRSASSAR